MVSATERKRRKEKQRVARQAERERKQRKIAERMCLRFGRPFTVLYLDYRYWTAKRCGFDPEIPSVWSWWRGLHPWDREMVLRYSPHDLIRPSSSWLRR